MNTRAAHPDHFFAAIEHGFSLLAAGLPDSILSTMSRGCALRGLTDAAAGYDHLRLRTMGDSDDSF